MLGPFFLPTRTLWPQTGNFSQFVGVRKVLVCFFEHKTDRWLVLKFGNLWNLPIVLHHSLSCRHTCKHQIHCKYGKGRRSTQLWGPTPFLLDWSIPGNAKNTTNKLVNFDTFNDFNCQTKYHVGKLSLFAVDPAEACATTEATKNKWALEGPVRKTDPTSPGHRNSFHGQHGPKTPCLATHHRLVQSVPTPRCQTWWGAYQTWTCGFPVSHATFQAGHILGLCHKCNFLIPSITGYLEWFQMK